MTRWVLTTASLMLLWASTTRLCAADVAFTVLPPTEVVHLERLCSREWPGPVTAGWQPTSEDIGQVEARLRLPLAGFTSRSEIGARRARVLAQVLKSVYVQEPSLIDGRVGFGTSVTVEEANGRRTSYEIVCPDEVEPARRQISVASPVARALLGKRAGDVVVLRRPRGDIEVTVVSVAVAPQETGQ
jgi:hypothetical protein